MKRHCLLRRILVLYSKMKWINSVCYTRLQCKTSYVEAMISGYWNP